MPPSPITLSRADLARRRVATGAVLAGLVVAAFEGTVVTPAMPTIVAELGGMSAYAWVFSAFLVASTVSVLASGKLADAFGRRPVFVGGMALFLLGSVLCGSAGSFGALVVFRVVQGLGAGALQPIAMTISADIYTLEERARIQGVFTGAWGAANVLGPVIGGWLVLHASWRWVFLVNVPVGVLSAFLLLISYRDPPRDVSASMRALARPFPREALRPRAVPAGLVASLFVGGILAACSAYVPLWITTQPGGDALSAGAALVPMLVGWAIGSSFGVRVLVARGMRASVGGGFTLALVGAVGLVLAVGQRAPTAYALLALGLLGLGLGPAASTSLVGPQSCVAWEHRGAVTSAVYAARLLGGSIVVAALGPLGTTPHAASLERFGAIAALALTGALATARLSPRSLHVPVADSGHAIQTQSPSQPDHGRGRPPVQVAE
jgi:predicted MFS family arabinose efflux permease